MHKWILVLALAAPAFSQTGTISGKVVDALGDAADGVTDGVIEDPLHCTWDPAAFVGTKVGAETFTAADANIVRQIWDGARARDGRLLWYGYTRGTNLFAIAGTEGVPLTGKPFGIAFEWVQFFLALDRNFDASQIGRAHV